MAEEPNFEWFEVREFPHDMIGIGEPGHFEDVKSFLIAGDDLAMLVDSGMGFANIRAVVDRYTDKPVLLVNSHGHLDHIGDNWRFERRWAHAGDLDRIRAGVPNERMHAFLAPDAFNRPMPSGLDPSTFSIPGTDVERTIDEGDEVDLGGRLFRVLHTPGHSAGSISLLEEETGILIAGDAIYEGPMFAHHQGGNARECRATVTRLADMVPNLSVVYPSHNRYPLPPSFIPRTTATRFHRRFSSMFEMRWSRSGMTGSRTLLRTVWSGSTLPRFPLRSLTAGERHSSSDSHRLESTYE